MIRVAVVDDAAIRSERGLVATGVASNGADVAEMLERHRRDVIVLDHHLPDPDGLIICRQIPTA
jgi:CheY-like chemotaxis protein